MAVLPLGPEADHYADVVEALMKQVDMLEATRTEILSLLPRPMGASDARAAIAIISNRTALGADKVDQIKVLVRSK